MALMLTLCLGAVAGWHWWFDTHGSADSLDAVLVYPANSGARVIVLDQVSYHVDDTPRLNLWLPREDAPRQRERVPRARMLAASTQLFWLYSPEHGVHARGPVTLPVRGDEAQLKQKNPSSRSA